MRTAEEAAFARGIEVEALMDQAGAGVARAVQQFFPEPGECIVYAGKGHNGGDALVAGERLQREGWSVTDVRLPFPESDCSELTRKKLAALRAGSKSSGGGRKPIAGQQNCEDNGPGETGVSLRGVLASTPKVGRTVILDGLLGVGTKSFLREPIRTAARELNRLRIERNAFVFAVDLPTGFNS